MPLIMLGPLLARGYVLTYDMVFTPHLNISWQAYHDGRSLPNALPLQLIIVALNHLIPPDIVQKVLLYGVFFTGIYGFYRSIPLPSRLARVVGSLVYSLNPFTYDRFMAGHWIFLLAYFLTPIALRAFYDLCTDYRLIRLVRAAGIWALIAMVSPHHIIILGILFVAVAATFVRTKRGVLQIFGTAALTIGLSSWWLLPTIFGSNFTHSFGLNDYYAFATKPDPTYGIWITLLSLQGFWYTAWHNLKDVAIWWPVVTGLWLAPVWVGLGAALRVRRTNSAAKLVLGLSILASVSLILAAGPNEPVGTLNSWLFLHVPGLRGLRESQKLLALVALFYAAAVTFSINYLAINKRQAYSLSLSIAAVALTITTSFYLFWGAHGQLHPVQYPVAWQNFYQYLQSRPSEERVLVLPYEVYLNKTFAGRLIASPAQPYFGDRVITGEDPKLPGLPAVFELKYQNLTTAIQQKNPTALFAAAHVLDIRYVMLITADDSPDYNWINKLPHSGLIESKELNVVRLTDK